MLPGVRAMDRKAERKALKQASRGGRRIPVMSSRAASRRGFTVLELLVTVVLLSLVAATSVRCYFAQANVTLENAAILLAYDLRAVQHRSTYTGETSHLRFSEEGDSYHVEDSTGKMVMNPQTSDPFERIYSKDGVFRGVRITKVDAGGDRTLDYDTHGWPVEDLEVTLSYNGSTRVVQFERRTAKLTLLGSTSGWVETE